MDGGGSRDVPAYQAGPTTNSQKKKQNRRVLWPCRVDVDHGYGRQWTFPLPYWNAELVRQFFVRFFSLFFFFFFLFYLSLSTLFFLTQKKRKKKKKKKQQTNGNERKKENTVRKCVSSSTRPSAMISASGWSVRTNRERVSAELVIRNI